MRISCTSCAKKQILRVHLSTSRHSAVLYLEIAEQQPLISCLSSCQAYSLIYLTLLAIIVDDQA